ncbi:hypothetical protein LPJ78_005363 [Coemansia sp. RSA 989]|nr:hypothetical protein LPJ68_005135 [Coemansia sp. RSA 1086]KAJ1747376.1 hypothetical protein LPJ79_005289 [Coemansia sp. RSA 1821]KAJ1861390.1 hypothetical protein LPJ78_005363 [Coemansia sp. RSA 989]KAJ1869401.1 hypothetical protein LPJ55_005384 [Coemansia sp. RSA 990]KAJ2669751.1 hypothetical protein IWW42_004433 [Coemansia sp. RSA 1085]
MGQPAQRVYSTPTPSDMQTSEMTSARQAAYTQLNSNRLSMQTRRRLAEGPLGIPRDSVLHNQLLLVDTPDPRLSQSRVSRLEVVRPADDDVIVVEGSGHDNSSKRRVEVIYHVIDNKYHLRMTKPKQPSALLRPMHGQAGREQGPENVPAGGLLLTTAHARQQKLQQQQQHTAPAAPRTGPLQQLATTTRPNTQLSVAGSSRPIAIPKSRLNKLQPAHRQMPRSKKLAEQGLLYGKLVVQRPDIFIIPTGQPAPGEPDFDLSDSYLNDPGYDLANATLDSRYFKSFDFDDLPDAPERRVSLYNLGGAFGARHSPTASAVDEQSMSSRSSVADRGVFGSDEFANVQDDLDKADYTEVLSGLPSPAVSRSNDKLRGRDSPVSGKSSATGFPSYQLPEHQLGASISSESEASAPRTGLMASITPKPHRTLGILSYDTEFAKPDIHEGNVDMYIRMLTLRSPINPEDLTPPTSPRSNHQSNPKSATSRAAAMPKALHTDGNRNARPQSIPTGPSIHRYQPQPTAPGNFWPTNTLDVSDAKDIGAKALSAHRDSEARHNWMLSQMSLSGSRSVFGRPKSPHQAERLSTRRYSSSKHQPSEATQASHKKELAYLPRDSRTEKPHTHDQLRRRATSGPETRSERFPQQQTLPVSRRANTDPNPQSVSLVPSRDGEKPSVATDNPPQCFSSRWPLWRWQWRRRADTDASVISLYSSSTNDEPPSPGYLRAINGSWAHIFRSQQRQQLAGRPVNNRQPGSKRQSRTRVRDVCAYPFRLTYNCFLWWFSPCVGLAREYR